MALNDLFLKDIGNFSTDVTRPEIGARDAYRSVEVTYGRIKFRQGL